MVKASAKVALDEAKQALRASRKAIEAAEAHQTLMADRCADARRHHAVVLRGVQREERNRARAQVKARAAQVLGRLAVTSVESLLAAEQHVFSAQPCDGIAALDALAQMWRVARRRRRFLAAIADRVGAAEESHVAVLIVDATLFSGTASFKLISPYHADFNDVVYTGFGPVAHWNPVSKCRDIEDIEANLGRFVAVTTQYFSHVLVRVGAQTLVCRAIDSEEAAEGLNWPETYDLNEAAAELTRESIDRAFAVTAETAKKLYIMDKSADGNEAEFFRIDAFFGLESCVQTRHPVVLLREGVEDGKPRYYSYNVATSRCEAKAYHGARDARRMMSIFRTAFGRLGPIRCQ